MKDRVIHTDQNKAMLYSEDSKFTNERMRFIKRMLTDSDFVARISLDDFILLERITRCDYTLYSEDVRHILKWLRQEWIKYKKDSNG
jgi:hypothetical protein